MKKLDCLINLLGNLKDLPRSGWLRKKTDNPESVAAHSFGVTLLTLLLLPEHLNRDKCLCLAAVHDLAEAKVGDYTPFDGISREEKYRLEAEAQKEIVEELACPALAALFDEYEQNQTPEARFVHDVDRLEAVLQAKYYDDHHRSAEPVLKEFISYAETHLNEPDGDIAGLIAGLKSLQKL